MNDLIFVRAGVVGSEAAVRALASAKSASVLVISDSHGMYAVFERILLEYGKTCDALVFCGDGSADVAEYLGRAAAEQAYCDALPPVVFCVRGNGDADQYAVRPYGLLKVPSKLEFTAAGCGVFVAHGNNYGVDFSIDMLASAAAAAECHAALFGHTHRSCALKRGNMTFVNPGSCAFPRGGTKASCVIAEFAEKKGCVDAHFLPV